MKLIKKLIVFSIIAGFAACGSDGSKPGSDGETGSFELNIAEDMSKIFILAIDMATDHYEILITGPRPAGPDNTRIRIIPNTDPMDPPAAQLFANLYKGRWTVTVNAKNAIDTTIGTGTNTVVVNPWSIGANVPQVTVTVTPIEGTGNLNITVSWNGDVTLEPVLSATLTPLNGTPIILSAVMNPARNGGTITNVNPLANGYYTLAVTLREREGLLVAGGADIVRIVTGQNTTGAINWGDLIDPHFGDFIVNIDPQMREPIFLTMSGNLAMIAQGDSMTLTAGVNAAATIPAVVGNVVYFWYENGEYLGTGDTITTPAHTLPEVDGLDQFYRVDVLAYTADGMRAGGSAFTYQVTESMTPNNSITAFSINGVAGTFSGSGSSIIDLVMPYGTNLTSLAPIIVTDGAKSVSPASGAAVNFTSPVTYTVRAYDPAIPPRIYTVTVNVALNPAKNITHFTINGINGIIGANTVNLVLPVGTNLTSLAPVITITGASVSPASGIAQDFTNPVVYRVTAEDSSTKDYTATVSIFNICQNGGIYTQLADDYECACTDGYTGKDCEIEPCQHGCIPFNPIAAGQLAPTGCETYIGAHPLYPGELLCCSSPSTGSAPVCAPGDTPDIPCVIEFEFCEDGTAMKAYSPDPITGMPGHTVSTSGSWSVDPDTGEMEIITTAPAMGGIMIMEMTETYPNAFTYDGGAKLDLQSSAAVYGTINGAGIGNYHRDAYSTTIISGVWAATLDADMNTDVTVTAAGYDSTFVQNIACSPSGGMVCQATPASKTVITSGTHTQPIDLYITPTGGKMYQTAEDKTFVFLRRPKTCDGIDCGEHGSCAEGLCVCTDGYIGNHCNVPGPCTGIDCGLNGTCVAGSCECDTGFEGNSCEVDINECNPNPCLNGSTCAQGVPGTYECTCINGFTGNNCENCPTDHDGDGYGNPASALCKHPEKDCNDNNRYIYPGAFEVCNDGIDNQCPGDVGYGTIDEGCETQIPAGCFDMGDAFAEGWPDELPVHNVCISAFKMDTHEVTNAEYAKCVADSGCTAPRSSSSYSRATYYGDQSYDAFPVIWMEWDQLYDYCTWAGKRLPTEAEWEYAARGGQAGKRYPWGDTISSTDANYGFNTGDTSRVESYAPNGYGLYDMAGNVWEWVADWFNESYYSVSPAYDPTGSASGMRRVARGGSWDHSTFGLRAANRCDFCHADRHGNNLGGRCVKE